MKKAVRKRKLGRAPQAGPAYQFFCLEIFVEDYIKMDSRHSINIINVIIVFLTTMFGFIH